MENLYRIAIRLTSDLYDFGELIPDINHYKISYNKKGDSIFSKSNTNSFNAKSNVFIVKDIHITNEISNEENSVIMNKLIPLIKILLVINVKDIKREIYISGRIENQQFGFSINHNLITLLSEYQYMISFSGISYIDSSESI